MGLLATQRRIAINMRGRTIALRRQATPVSPTVTALAFSRAFTPGELQAGVQQGDARVEITNDEIAAAAWPAPPRNPDRVAMDGRAWTVQGAVAVMEGAQVIGWSIWLRGA